MGLVAGCLGDGFSTNYFPLLRVGAASYGFTAENVRCSVVIVPDVGCLVFGAHVEKCHNDNVAPSPFQVGHVVMSNPYQSMVNIAATRPGRLAGVWYWLAWGLGTMSIILSWLSIVPPLIGWTGFGLALVAAVVSQFFLADQTIPHRPRDLAVLTNEMVDRRDHGYRVATRQCRSGGTVLYDGVAVTITADGIVCSTISPLPPEELDEFHAQEQARVAEAAVGRLVDEVPDFSVDSTLHPIVTVIISEFGKNGIEICRVIEGDVAWATR